MRSIDQAHHELEPSDDVGVVRTAVRRCAEALGRPDLTDDVALVASELLTNAVFHGGGCTGVQVRQIPEGLRIEVRDRSRLPPMLAQPFDGSLTGRGLRLVAGLSARWGADGEPDGKVVWAEVTGEGQGMPAEMRRDDLLAMWDDDGDLGWRDDREHRLHVELGDVPTDLLLAAKSHVDNVVREFTLARAGARAGQTAELPAHLRSLLEPVVERFAEARLAIKRQALAAARRGDPRTRLTLDLPFSAADAAEAYLHALDEVDAYCRARRLLTLETPPQHQLFRRWYVEELVIQLRAAASGHTAPKPQSFEARLLAELDRVAGARRAAERAAGLYTVASALATAATPEAVADAVLNEGVAALGAAAGGVLLASDADRLLLPGAVGYDEGVLERLRSESPSTELPAAEALRTGESVWIESRAERDRRFPGLEGFEAGTIALCAVPLEAHGRRLGAVRFSFREARLFDHDEKQFVLALAAQTAQALDRAELQRARIDVSRRLQRSLLPPSVPRIDGLEVVAIYHPFGDGIDVGGDFYDVWPVRPGRWAFAIGDAAGTGPEAAALTALVRHTLRALTLTEADPARVVRILNTALLDAAEDAYGERFCTAVFGFISVGEEVEVWLASGGHPPPLLRRPAGHIDVLPLTGSLLGLFRDAEAHSLRLRLEPGDTLVMFTDGVLEARRDGQFFDLTGVLRVLGRDLPGVGAAAAAAALEQAVVDHTGGKLTDDLAAVVLHVPGG